MKVVVTVKPNGKQQKITMSGNGDFVVRLRSPPVDGKANAELIQLLAKHFRVRRSQVVIVHGQTARRKLVEIDHGE